jgi:hypothetical protein
LRYRKNFIWKIVYATQTASDGIGIMTRCRGLLLRRASSRPAVELVIIPFTRPKLQMKRGWEQISARRYLICHGQARDRSADFGRDHIE